jgi:hypothetical protein
LRKKETWIKSRSLSFHTWVSGVWGASGLVVLDRDPGPALYFLHLIDAVFAEIKSKWIRAMHTFSDIL